MLAALRPTSDQLQDGLSIFFDHLLRVLDKEPDTISANDELKILDSSCEYGREFWKLGYTLSHVVHAFGALCQATTEIAREIDAPITAHEFHHLNRCLDIAIAGAVTEFESSSVSESKKREALHLGFISHELRNALNRARISFQMLSKGIVGLGGSTSKVLEKSLEDMDILISRSISEVRLRANSPIEKECIAVIEAISQLAITAEVEAARRNQTLSFDIDPECIILADKILFMSAIGNLLQNALKYSEDGGHISVTGNKKNQSVIIKVKDQCGGIPEDKMKNLFRPFTQESADKSGLGLGLVIAKKAIEASGGTLSLNNIDQGCVFTIELPYFDDPEKNKKNSIV